MTFNDTEEYSLRSIAILGCNIYSQIVVAHVTLPKAVLSTVKIFAVCFDFIERIYFMAFRFQSDTKKQLLDLKSVLRYRAWVLIH